MEKQKRWQLYLIIAVLLLTVYNILPTIFFYINPLRAPIDAPRAQHVAQEIVTRVNALEEESIAWLRSFCRLLNIRPRAITINTEHDGLISLSFDREEDASLFRRFLPRAGALIPFMPAQLSLAETGGERTSSEVFVQQQLWSPLRSDQASSPFQFVLKRNADGEWTNDYRSLVSDRIMQMARILAGQTSEAIHMHAIIADRDGSHDLEAIALAQQIVDIDAVFGAGSTVAKRYYASFIRAGSATASEEMPAQFLGKLEGVLKRVKERRDGLSGSSSLLSGAQEEELLLATQQIRTIEGAMRIVRLQFVDLPATPSIAQVEEEVRTFFASTPNPSSENTLWLKEAHPLIQGLVIHQENSTVAIQLYEDVQKLRMYNDRSEQAAFIRERVNQLVINAIADLSRLSEETFIPTEESFAISLDTLPNSTGYLILKLKDVAKEMSQLVASRIASSWTPLHLDLERSVYPIFSFDAYQNATPAARKLGLLVYAPAAETNSPLEGFRRQSLYVIAKGAAELRKKVSESPEEPENRQLAADLNQLTQLMQQMGFIEYVGTTFELPKEWANDDIFELDDYYAPLIMATREEFQVKGTQQYAVLDFSDVEQRLLTQNKIDDRIQEDLLKWREAYHAAQVDLNVTSRYTVPAPTKNAFWENLKLSVVKYFRGDDRKVLKWGLDLSGGKTVRIALIDQNNRPVKNPDELRQAVNELYHRINQMGVAERTIRIEDANIVLDFPGSQNLSASDLVKASAMYFHVVNEKFGPNNPNLSLTVNRFLQDVWNEAVVTNRKDSESIQEIAWHQLGGDLQGGNAVHPRTEHARVLFDNGLRLAHPKERNASTTFDDTLSEIAVLRGEEATEWNQQTHPLLIVFHHYALEGSSLENIQAGYDTTQGNVLSFGVKRAYGKGREGSPRDDFYTWTSQFAEDRIAGTPKETYSQGRGWRMAVILNGTVITAPSLNASLREGGTISGRFSQREVNRLAADLKAGSLSFTPRILSEENVSPELGQEERAKGIIASVVALLLVVVAMVGYYRFAGLVASGAVLLNILIMWGVLQNLGAALTLPGIAGIVLTIGMAVDANVLVFERIREEFKISGRLASAIQAGYRKAFSAILDSNLTTIIAALILIQFDSGPIKGFAVTLIIGIVSSMFTALFMTRYFFAGWIRNPANKQLTMAQFLKETHFDFLGKAKQALIASLLVMMVGTYFLIAQRNTIFGMDFTGGYSLTVDLVEQSSHPAYRQVAIEALLDRGASRRDFEVRELSRPNQLRIQLGTSMDEKGHPFYQMAEINPHEGSYAYEYQHDPRLNWVVETLQSHGLEINPSQLATLQKNWTIMSGQLSDTMRNHAILALGAALVFILIYITFRFEFKYAVGAVAGLIHDVAITLGILAFFQAMGFAVQIDLQVVGALMTIIGYSLNDTIIIFDRIREDIRVMRRVPFKEVVNHALNVTLSRTIMTSGTTLLVLIALVLLGGHSIFSFSLVMTVGVLVGTLSSLFVASPVMLFFHQREEERLSQSHHHSSFKSS